MSRSRDYTKKYRRAVYNAISKYYDVDEQKLDDFIKDNTLSVSRPKVEAFLKKLKPIKSTAKDEGRVDDRVNNILPYLQDQGNITTLLDVGAGDASITQALKDELKLKKADVYSIDVHEIKNDEVTILQYEKGFKLPLKDNSIDVVLLLMVLHHIKVEDRKTIISEIYRVLKPDGVLVVREHDMPYIKRTRGAALPDSDFEGMMNFIHYVHMFAKGEDYPYYAQYLTETQAAALFINTGFKAYGSVDKADNTQATYFMAFRKPVPLQTQQTTPRRTPRVRITEEKKKEEPVVETKQTFTSPLILQSYRNKPVTNKVWSDNLIEFLSGLVGRIINDKLTINKFFDTQDKVALWQQTFTHETWSASENYESLEYLGDSVLKLIFPRFIIAKKPDLTTFEYTELNSYYMGNEQLAIFSDELGLPRYLRFINSNKVVPNPIRADLFEAFFATLFRVSELVKKDTGYLTTFNFLLKFFENKTFNTDRAKGDPVTVVTQLIERFRPYIITDKGQQKRARLFYVNYNGNETSLAFDFKTTNFFNRLLPRDVQMDKYKVFTAKGDKKTAKRDVFQQAFNYLLNYKLTVEWAQKFRENLEMSESELKAQESKLKQQLAKDNYQRAFFNIRRDANDLAKKAIEMIGQRQDKTEEVINVIYTNDENLIPAKLELFKDYLS